MILRQIMSSVCLDLSDLGQIRPLAKDGRGMHIQCREHYETGPHAHNNALPCCVGRFPCLYALVASPMSDFLGIQQDLADSVTPRPHP